MIEKIHLAEEGFNHLADEEIEKLRTEVANLKRQIEDLRSDLRYYELQATKCY
jgi:cell division protein FtsB